MSTATKTSTGGSGHYDAETIRLAVRGHAVDVLENVARIPRDALDGKHHPCFRCGGKDRFRLIDKDAGAVLCNQCFSDKNGDVFSAVQWSLGVDFPTALRLVARHLGLQPSKNGRGKKADSNGRATRPKRFATARGIVLHYINLLTKTHGPGVKLVQTWAYDTFHVLRFNPPTPPGEKQEKVFRPVHPVPLGSNGATGWQVGYPPGPRPLYRRAELEAANDHSLAVVCAGEKATDAAVKLGLVATTNAGGELAVGKTNWSPVLRFATVAIIVDNDPAGEKYGQLVAAALLKLKPELTIKIIRLPDLPPKGDIVEWIEAGGTQEEFLRLVDAAAVVTAEQVKEASKQGDVADPLKREREIADALGLLVMGESADHSVSVFSRHLGKVDKIKSVASLKYSDLLQIGGPTIRERVVQTSDDDVSPDKMTVSDVKNAFALLASQRRITPGLACGQGFHVGRTGKAIIVDSGGGAIWAPEQRKLLPVGEPFADGKLLDFECVKAIDLVDLEKRLASMSTERTAAAVDRLACILKEWKWRPVDSHIVAAGLVVATMVQTAWQWRPQVAVTGESGSGKTTLFDTLSTMLGGLALRADKPTEAGLRQAIGNAAPAVLIDEFEKSRDRQRILELIRTASRGSRILRGTVDQRGVSFGLRHICWIASVELGLTRQPDRNRFIRFELLKSDRWMEIPDSQTLRELGRELFAVAVYLCSDAVALSESLKQIQLPEVDPRIVESFSVPAAVLAVAGVFGSTTSEEILTSMIGCTGNHAADTESDQLALLRDILAVKIVVNKELLTAGEILSDPHQFNGSTEALERDGLKRCGDLFVAPRLIEARLKGGIWDGQSTREILVRLPGAEAGHHVRRRCGGVLHRGVLIPWEIVDQFIGCGDDEAGTDF